MASSLVAHADRLTAPADAPASFQAECASCHVAFPPQLLAAEDWRKVMATLNKHYGDNASLDDKTRREIEAFLTKNAGGERVASQTNAGSLPRLTTTSWFVRKHREVRSSDWKHDKVRSPANCSGCHTKAAAGSYREREIVMPDGRRWEDD
jgi:mono/diheme cytochrome c family protein